MPDIPDWLQQWLKTVSAWDVALWVLGLTCAVWLIRRFITKGWPALKRFAKAVLHFAQIVDAVQDLPKFIERTDTKIAEIHHETHKNDGSSIKDSSDRTELAVGRVEEGVAGLYERVAAVESSLAGVHGRLDDVDRELSTLAAADDDLRDGAAELRRDFENTHPKTEIHPTQGES